MEIAPKYPGLPLWGGGPATQDRRCSADSPFPWLPAWFSVSPPCTKGFMGVLCCTFPLSLRPLPDLGGGKNADFGKTLWVLTGEGRDCRTHWRHSWVSPPAPTSKSQPPTSFRRRARRDPPWSHSHPGVGAPRDFSRRGTHHPPGPRSPRQRLLLCRQSGAGAEAAAGPGARALLEEKAHRGRLKRQQRPRSPHARVSVEQLCGVRRGRL